MTDTPVPDSYIPTLEEAAAYFAKRLGSSAWSSASPADKTAALQESTALIDALPLKGRKRDGTQVRAFPRDYMTPQGWIADQEEIPQKVKDACCETAMALLQEISSNDLSPEMLQQAGIKSFRLGELSMDFKDDAATRYRGLKCKRAHDLMSPFISRSVVAR